MPLSAADRVLIYSDQLRGFETDLLRSEVLAEGGSVYDRDDRVPLLNAQIAVVEKRLDEAIKESAAESDQILSEFVAANAPADGWLDDYESQKKAELLELFPQRGIVPGDKDTIPVLIDKLRAYDLQHQGIAVAAGVTPGA